MLPLMFVLTLALVAPAVMFAFALVLSATIMDGHDATYGEAEDGQAWNQNEDSEFHDGLRK